MANDPDSAIIPSAKIDEKWKGAKHVGAPHSAPQIAPQILRDQKLAQNGVSNIGAPTRFAHLWVSPSGGVGSTFQPNHSSYGGVATNNQHGGVDSLLPPKHSSSPPDLPLDLLLPVNSRRSVGTAPSTNKAIHPFFSLAFLDKPILPAWGG